MASFVEVPGANGKVRIKAVCRVWRGKKQATKCKTFAGREEAKRWADEIEHTMQKEVMGEKLEALKIKKKAYLPEIETIKDVQDIYQKAQDNISQLGQESFLLIRVDTIVQYFEGRIEAGGSEEELELEADLLYSMFGYLAKKTGRRDANLVQMALTALRTRGLIQ